MTSDYRSAGRTTLTPDVLLTIARQAALEVEGVHGMAAVKGGVDRMLWRGNDGVRIKMEDDNVLIDLYLVVKSDVNLREVSRNVQVKVARAIAEMTGLEVGHVDIHIEDVYYQPES
jgi:uncharacterized alkaline shock family protein YloU